MVEVQSKSFQKGEWEKRDINGRNKYMYIFKYMEMFQ
jgi:hypothetical protein